MCGYKHPAVCSLVANYQRLSCTKALTGMLLVGYPLDIPPVGAGLLTYAVLVYHLPLLIGFSLRPRAAFVWGGCMLLPLAHLRADTYGIMAVRWCRSVCMRLY